MNVIYLIVMLAIVFISIVIAAAGQEEFAIIGGAITLAMFVISLVVPLGTTTITLVPFELEKTPYRVIIKADKTEQTFIDAKTVLHVDEIEEVQSIVEHNAWGGQLSVTLVPIFKK